MDWLSTQVQSAMADMPATVKPLLLQLPRADELLERLPGTEEQKLAIVASGAAVGVAPGGLGVRLRTIRPWYGGTLRRPRRTQTRRTYTSRTCREDIVWERNKGLRNKSTFGDMRYE